MASSTRRGKGPTHVYVLPEPKVYVVVDPDGSVSIRGWDSSSLEVTGQLAGEVVAGLAAGRIEESTAARIAAVGERMEPHRKALLRALLSGTPRPAGPADLVRRDGYGLLWIELTSRCNLSCEHCYASATDGEGLTLELKAVTTVLRDAAELGFRWVQLTGGEPLLCPFLVEAVEEARGLGLGVEVFSNGLELHPSLLERLAANDAAFAFSLYADQPAVHDHITKVAGSWHRTVDAIRRVVARGAAARVAIVLMEANQQRAAETVAFAQTLVGLADVGVDVVRGVGRGCFDPEIQMPLLPAQLHHPSAEEESSHLGKACVASDGVVYPCIFSRWLALGRIEAGGLKQALLQPHPQPAWQIPDSQDVVAICGERLACDECRATAILLARMVDGTSTT